MQGHRIIQLISIPVSYTHLPAEPSSDNSQETVKTGDNSNIMLYVLMLATCVAGATTVVVTGRKKSEQE